MQVILDKYNEYIRETGRPPRWIVTNEKGLKQIEETLKLPDGLKLTELYGMRIAIIYRPTRSTSEPPIYHVTG